MKVTLRKESDKVYKKHFSGIGSYNYITLKRDNGIWFGKAMKTNGEIFEFSHPDIEEVRKQFIDQENLELVISEF